MPADCLWDPKAMADQFAVSIPQGKILFLLNLSQTVVRFSDSLDPDTTFPFGDRSSKYIFSHNIIEEKKFWMTALPAEISHRLVEMCRLKRIHPNRIQAIDTLEYRMAHYFGKQYKAPLWLLLPQVPGIRLITMEGGLPCSCYFFSNDFRFQELARLWMCQSIPPQYAIVLAEDEDMRYQWLREFLEEKSVELLRHDQGQDFKQAMIEEFVT